MSNFDFMNYFLSINKTINEANSVRSQAWCQGFRDYEQNGQYNENKFKTESERMDYDSGFNYAKSLRDEEAGGEDVMETQMKGDGEGAFVTKSPEEVAKIKVEKMYGKKKDKEVKEADENQTPELRNDVEEEEEKAQLGSIVSEPSFFGGMSESMDSFDQIAEAFNRQLSVPDMHQKRICIDTVKNPLKGQFLGGPSAEEAKEILKTKFGYTPEQIAKLEESVNEEAKVGVKVQYHDGGIKKSATVKSVWKSATGVDFATLKTAEGEKDVPLDKLKEAIVKVKESYDGAADELKLYIDNTRNLYDSLSGEFSQNLYRKMKKGVYDKNLAVKLMMYLVDRAAKQYTSEFDAAGARMQDTFPKQSREKVAVALVQDWEEAYKAGEWGMEAPKANESKVPVDPNELRGNIIENPSEDGVKWAKDGKSFSQAKIHAGLVYKEDSPEMKTFWSAYEKNSKANESILQVMVVGNKSQVALDMAKYKIPFAFVKEESNLSHVSGPVTVGKINSEFLPNLKEFNSATSAVVEVIELKESTEYNGQKVSDRKFNFDDIVSRDDDSAQGKVVFLGGYDDYAKTWRYKVDSDGSVKWWNESSMKLLKKANESVNEAAGQPLSVFNVDSAKVNSAKNSSESVVSEEYDPHIIQGSIYAMKNQKDLTPEEIKTQFPEVDVERFLIGQSNARAVVKGHKGVNVVVDGKRVNDVPFPSSTAAMSWAQANLPDKNYEFEKIGESKIDEAIASQALISELKVILQSLEKEDKEFALDRLRKLVTAAIRDGIA
jgi:hypothetical protein